MFLRFWIDAAFHSVATDLGYAAGMSMMWAGVVGLMVGLGQAVAPAGDGAMLSYHDAALGLTYRYPAAMKPRPELAEAIARGLERGSSEDGSASVAKCITVPVSVMQNPEGSPEGDFGMLLMMRVDHACTGEPGTKELLGEAAQAFTKVLKNFGLPLTEDAMAYKLDGHDASFVKGSVQTKMLGEGKMLHSAAVCSLVGTNTVCWLIVDSNHKAMPGLVGSLVVFDGRVGVALVPGDLVTKW